MTFLECVLQTISEAGLSGPIAYPGINFTPPDTGTWLEVRLFENDPDDSGLSNDAGYTERGILQITACSRGGTGIVPAAQLAAQVEAAFPKGKVLCKKIRVTRPATRLSDPDQPDRVMIPVRFRYSA